MATSQTETTYYDSQLETLPREVLFQLQQRHFRKVLRQALQSNPFYQRKLQAAGIRRAVPLNRLTELPFTTKAEVVADQLEHPPFGSNLSFPLDHYTRLHQTSGTTGAPLRWLDRPDDYESFLRQWRFVYRGAGVGRGDRVFVAFSFGPFYGFWGGFEAAQQLGCLAITGGGQSSEQRLVQMQATRPTVLVCTPTYALRLAEVAHSLGIDTAGLGLRVTIHAGEPGASIPATRQRIQQFYGARAYDHCGMTELGGIGFECQCQLGPHVNESEFLLELIDPQTGRSLSGGGRGEIVFTSLRRIGSPLIRYRSGDLADVVLERCTCGRTFALLRGGILGRADDMITVRGVNVFPTAIENILRQFPQIVEFQGEIKLEREMQELILRVETESMGEEQQQALAHRIIAEMHTHLHLRPLVQFASPGSLPRAETKSRRFRTAPPA